ncbi:TonB-dependent siderophore receptor [Agrobacterium cavarae]|uniref:TonB-dependent receptor n=1 Tax=Agrobacterium cavarae TaxID=2528239 RepID=UPI002FD9E2F9
MSVLNYGVRVNSYGFAILASVSLLALEPALAQGQDAGPVQNGSTTPTVLKPIVIRGARDGRPATATIGQPAAAFSGGQVSTEARLGALGNRPIKDTPFSITAYTAKLIRDQQAQTVADITLNDPSVRADAPPFSERDSFLIRGFPVVNLDIFYDGLPYIANPRRHFLEGIEQVQVLKGPSNFINGGIGRVGGTINLVPKRAADEPLTRLTTGYRSDSQLWTHADVGRRFGESDEWGIRANGSFRGGETSLDHNDTRIGVASLGIDYRGEDFRASLDLSHSTQRLDSPTSLFNSASAGLSAIPRAPNGRINTANPFEYLDSSYNMVAGRLEYDVLDNTTIYAAAGASRYREDFLTSSYTILNSNGDASVAFGYNPQEIIGYSGETGIRSEFETGEIEHKLNASLSVSLNQNHRGYFNPSALGFPTYTTNIYNPIYLPSGSVNTSGLPRSNNLGRFAELLSTSLSLSDTASLFDDRLELTIGGRYQDMRSEGFNTRPSAGPAGFRNYLYQEARFSPAVAATYKLQDNISLYANYVEALTEGAIAPATASNAGQIFPPFVNKQKEVGLKYDTGSTMLTAALFEIRQASGFTTSGVFGVNGLQINRGLELTAYGEPSDGVRLLGGVTFLDAELARTNGGTFNGKRAPGVPEISISLYGEYDLPWVEGLTATGRVVYSGSTYYNQANTQKVDSWTRVDLGARYKFERENGKAVELRANVENVFNEDYWASSARGWLAAGAARTFMVSASFDF